MTRNELFGLVVRRPALLAAMAFAIAALQGPGANLTSFYLYWQDRWLLLAGVLLLAVCVWQFRAYERPLENGWRSASAIGAIMAIAAFAGHYLILHGHDLSRDEQMASFDAAVFAQGQLVAPLTGIWRDHSEALNTMFMYPTTQTAAWISAYLPMNAVLRAFFSLLGDAALTGPAMVLIGALALWGCVRRLFPSSPEAATVALLLYAGSGQILFNGMTAYAMPAHLALNLCWFWFFLRGSLRSDLAALAIGFVAVGLHQPIVHPMFAAPILFLLVLERDWRRASRYFLGYLAIGAFWAWWPGAMWLLVEADAAAPRSEGIDYLSRLVATVLEGDGMRVANMASNVLRFFAWQHILLLPLLALGVGLVRRDRFAGALLGGILLTTAVMFIILPYQGHGFGYRYFHGLIGSFILLAVYGWVSISDGQPLWRGLLVHTTAATLVVLLPVQAWMAHGFYAPFADASERIAATGADFAVVGEDDAPFIVDLVINPPALDERPIRLMRGAVDPELAKVLCSVRSAPLVALAGPGLVQSLRDYYAFKSRSTDAEAANRTVVTRLRRAGCRTMIIG